MADRHVSNLSRGVERSQTIAGRSIVKIVSVTGGSTASQAKARSYVSAVRCRVQNVGGAIVTLVIHVPQSAEDGAYWPAIQRSSMPSHEAPL